MCDPTSGSETQRMGAGLAAVTVKGKAFVSLSRLHSVCPSQEILGVTCYILLSPKELVNVNTCTSVYQPKALLFLLSDHSCWHYWRRRL